MSVQTTASIIVKTKDGQTLVLDPNEKVISETYSTVTCDGPRCASRHGLKEPKSFSFMVEKVRENPDELPEEGDNWIPIILPDRAIQNDGRNRAVCSIQCLKDFWTYEYKGINARPKLVQKTDNILEQTPVKCSKELEQSVDKNEQLLIELANIHDANEVEVTGDTIIVDMPEIGVSDVEVTVAEI